MKKAVHVCRDRASVKVLDDISFIFCKYDSRKVRVISKQQNYRLWLLFNDHPVELHVLQGVYNPLAGKNVRYHRKPWSGAKSMNPVSLSMNDTNTSQFDAIVTRFSIQNCGLLSMLLGRPSLFLLGSESVCNTPRMSDSSVYYDRISTEVDWIGNLRRSIGNIALKSLSMTDVPKSSGTPSLSTTPKWIHLCRLPAWSNSITWPIWWTRLLDADVSYMHCTGRT